MKRTCPRIEDYIVGWVCALPIELATAMEMLDEEHYNLPQDGNDTNLYALGRIGEHNVVIACLPAGQMGTNSAATVVVQMSDEVEIPLNSVWPDGGHWRRGTKHRIRHTTW
jgi:hypothetical protein